MKNEKQSTNVFEHICEKFAKYSKKRNITLSGTPTPCRVRILSAKNNRWTEHMAVKAFKAEIVQKHEIALTMLKYNKSGRKAELRPQMFSVQIKKHVKGFLINISDKTLKFFSSDEVIVRPIKKGDGFKNNQVVKTGFVKKNKGVAKPHPAKDFRYKEEPEMAATEKGKNYSL